MAADQHARKGAISPGCVPYAVQGAPPALEASLYRGVASRRDTHSLCEAVLALVERLLPASGSLIYRVRSESGEAALCATGGLGLNAVELEWLRKRANVTVRRRDFTVGPEREDPCRADSTGRAIRMRSLLNCPLRVGAETVGVLQLWDTSEGALGSHEGPTLCLVADLAARALRLADVGADSGRPGKRPEVDFRGEDPGPDEICSALHRRHRIATLGRFAPYIAHEINDSLSYMISNLGRAIEVAADLEVAAASADFDRSHLHSTSMYLGDLIRDVLDGADRIGNVAQGVCSFEATSPADRSDEDLAPIIGAVIHLLVPETGGGVGFDFRAETHALARCHRYQIAYVVLNLLENVIEAIEGRGTVWLRLRVVAAWVELEVSDGGPGVLRDRLDRIIEAPQSSPGEATGLGVRVSRAVATEHGGSLTVGGEDGEAASGVSFRLRLPIAHEARS